MNALRVLHVSPYFTPAYCYGGPPRSIHGLCRALVAAGVDVSVMTTTANGATRLPPVVDRPVSIDGVPTRFFPIARTTFPWYAPALRRALRRETASYDVVHVHGLWHLPGWDAGRAARAGGVPYLISPRGMLEPEALARHQTRKAIAFRLIEQRHLGRAAALHATSPEEAATITACRLGPPVMTAPNGVALDELTSVDPGPVLARFGIDPALPYILFLGRVHPIKRLDLLADAAALLRTRAAQIVIAGPDEVGLRASLAPRFAASGMRTVWTGGVEGADKAALLTAATTAVLCSDSESFGLAIAEAMAVGTPVVVTHTCPWREVETEGAGLWVPQTAAAIARAIDRLLAHRESARAMGERARALVQRKYTWSCAARLIIDCYERMIAPRRRLARVR